MKIKNVEKIVFQVLQDIPETRSDDFLLIYWSFYKFGNEDVRFLPFGTIMHYHKDLGLPSMHSITRARRKVFKEHPELKPKKVTDLRAEQEQQFREYALEK